MVEDAAADLDETIEAWRQPLDEIVEIVRDVWGTNVQRYEPLLGDDAVTLGITSSRNIANRTVAHFAGHPTVRAGMADNSLLVQHDGVYLRQYKVADVDLIDWDGSATRLAGPRTNDVATRQLALDEAGDPVVAQYFRRVGFPALHLAWIGEVDGGRTSVWVGYPRDNSDGGSPWYAVRALHRDTVGTGAGQPAGSAAPAPPYSDLAPAVVQLEIQPATRRAGG